MKHDVVLWLNMEVTKIKFFNKEKGKLRNCKKKKELRHGWRDLQRKRDTDSLMGQRYRRFLQRNNDNQTLYIHTERAKRKGRESNGQWTASKPKETKEETESSTVNVIKQKNKQSRQWMI